jgi:hypothetical protein
MYIRAFERQWIIFRVRFTGHVGGTNLRKLEESTKMGFKENCRGD